jgi:hypothetical protein
VDAISHDGGESAVEVRWVLGPRDVVETVVMDLRRYQEDAIGEEASKLVVEGLLVNVGTL